MRVQDLATKVMTLEADRREAKCELRATEQRHQEGAAGPWGDPVAMASPVAGGCDPGSGWKSVGFWHLQKLVDVDCDLSTCGCWEPPPPCGYEGDWRMCGCVLPTFGGMLMSILTMLMPHARDRLW